MAEGTVTYIYPTWGLSPQKGHKFHSVHALVKFDDDSTLPMEIKHNLDLPYGAPLQPPEWIPPILVVNQIAGGAVAPPHRLTVIDGNTVTIGRPVSGGPAGSNVTYDVWIFKPKLDSSWGW